MKKSIFKKLGGLFLGLAMGLGVAAGVTAGNKASEVKAAEATWTWTTSSSKKLSTTAGSNTLAGLVGSTTVNVSGTTAVTGGAIGNFENSSYGGQQMGTGSSNMTNFTLTIGTPWTTNSTYKSYTKIKSISLSGACGSSTKYTVSATIDGVAATNSNSVNTLYVGTGKTHNTCTFTPATGHEIGAIVFTVSKTSGSKAWYLGTITIVAEEPPTGFDVTYNANKPSAATGNVSGMPSNAIGVSTHTVSSTKPTLAGYKFDGWATSTSGVVVYTGGETLSAAAALYAHWTAKTQITLTADDLDLDLQNDAGGVAPLNPNQSGITYIVDDTSIATYSDGKFYPQAVGETLVTMSKDEDDNNVYEDNVFVITVTSSVSSYAVTWTNTNASVTGSDAIYDGEQETYTITAASGYKLPDTVSVSGATSLYSKTTFNAATLTISEATGPVSFSVAGIALADYGISFAGENYTHTAVTTIQEFGSATITLTPAAHYDLPASVSVTNAEQSYTKSNGQLVISNPTGAVTISVDPVAREHYSISVSGAGDYASHFSYSGHENGIYATESIQVTISPDTSSDDIYVISASNISVSGATKGTYSNNKLTISNPTGNVTITVTPVLKVLQSIRVATNPTKTSGYKNGDTLDTTGLVVKGVFTTGEETIPTANLTFSQTKLAVVGTAGSASNETIYVYYGGKSASFNVSVSPIATGTSGWKKTESIAVGDKIIFVYETGSVELGGLSSTSTVYGTSQSYSDSGKPSGAYPLNVVAGNATGSFAFKTSADTYLQWSSGNSLTTKNSIDGNSSWTLDSSSTGGNFRFVNVNTTTRKLAYNSATSGLRWATYSSDQTAFQIYKFEEAAPKAGVAINATYTAGSYTADDEIDLSKLSTTLVYNDGTSSSVSGATISPSTYVEGTAEYTVTYSTYSTVIQIADVAPAKQMTGIRVDDTNVTKAFVVGGTFESDGLVVYAVFDNGTEEVLESGYDVVDDDVDMSTAGTYTVYVTYGDFEAQSYEIEVSDSSIMNIVEGAAISGFEGESYNLEIELLNYSGSTSWVFDPASSEYYEINVTSEDDSGLVASVTLKKATAEALTVEISEENSGAEPVEITIDVDADYLTGIEVTSSKLAYTDGEYFDYGSVTVTASYASSTHEDEEIDIGDCTVTAVNSRSQAFDLDNPLVIETYTITVEYEGESDSFNISVSMPEGLKVVVGTEHYGSSTYTLVESTSLLKAGKKYIIVGIKNSAYYAMEAYASGNNCRSKAINDTPDANGVIDNASTGLCEFTLGGSTGNWTLKGGSYYLYAAGGTSNNYLKGTDSADNLNAQWTISIAADGKATVVTADTAVTKNTMRFNTNNSNDPLFSCYSSGQTDIYFYEVTPGESSFTYDYVDVSSTLYAFIRDTYTCEGGGLSTLSGWDDAFDTTLNPSYALLTDDDKAILKNGFVSGEVEGVTRESWDAFAGFITSYDRAVASGCTNYLDRAKTSPSRINPIVALNEVDNSVWIISAVAVAGLTAIGGYFFYRKRKEI